MKQSLAAIFSSVFLTAFMTINEVAAVPPKTATSEKVAPPMQTLPATGSWGMQLRWDESTKIENLIEDVDVILTPHVPVQISTEFQKIRELAFSKADGSGSSAGVGAVLHADIQNQTLHSVENKMGRAASEAYTVTLNPDICLYWRVRKYETTKMAYYSAPKADIPEEYAFWMPLSRRIEVTNKCDPKPAP
jgi:hypothetical protein